MSKTKNFKGYHSVLSSNNDPLNSGDMHEGICHFALALSRYIIQSHHSGFEIGWEQLLTEPNDRKEAKDGIMAGANVWPSEEEAPCFRESLLTY
jgi:hypothetical protein